MKHMDLNLHDRNRLQKVAHALSSDLRLRILALLDERSMNVLELSQRLEMPISTVSNSINVLEEAELIRTERQAAVRGVERLCSRRNDTVTITLNHVYSRDVESFQYEMPIGLYSDCRVEPVCGLLSQSGAIGEQDDAAAFYDPRHNEAQLLWFHQGYVEYRFSSQIMRTHDVKCLEFSFEACSEAPNYRLDWPSDITVWVNDVALGTWCCPGDFGGRQGRFTPVWWLPSSTQYGLLTRWKIDHTGTYLNDEPLSPVTLNDLRKPELPYASLKIGVQPDAVHVGGINLFGESFGDHRQAITMRVDYAARKPSELGG